jgi:hypothetical protein
VGLAAGLPRPIRTGGAPDMYAGIRDDHCTASEGA